jgi:hypothetical protein
MRVGRDSFSIRIRSHTESISNQDLLARRLDYDAIILPAENENTIMNGLSAQRYPAEFAGGIGDAGVENLKKFVDGGGKLICFDDSCESSSRSLVCHCGTCSTDSREINSTIRVRS